MQTNEINKSELIAIRSGTDDDKNFIYASWLRGLYYGDSWFSEVPKNIFMEHYHKVIEFILSKPDTEVRIACLKEEPSVILGYSVSSDQALHFVFVKKKWRKIKIAQDLVPQGLNTATHLTKVGLSLLKQKGWTFNPFIT